MSHRCAVWGCDNDYKHPEKWLIMPHVRENLGTDATIKLHKCPKESWYSKWTKLLNREGFHVTKHSRICSNHFEYGQPREQSPHPKLFLKGYPGRESISKRRQLVRKKLETFLPASDETPASSLTVEESLCAVPDNVQQSRSYEELEAENKQLHEIQAAQASQIEEYEKEIQELKQLNTFGIHSIKRSDHLVKVYTGLTSYALFSWLFDEVKEVASNMKYYKGEQSVDTKAYQESNTKKPGPKRKVCLEDELLMCLMKLRLNLSHEFLASMFKVSPSLVSSIVSTWICLLALELKPILHWPSDVQLLQYYPDCFKKYGKVCAIIDCTEVQTERPSLDSTNAAMYSNYKERHTYKVLVACTPGGTVSYISDAVGGDMSDVELVRRCGILDKLKRDDKVMADKGFSNKDDFMIGGVELITPEFRKKDIQFTVAKNVINAEVSNARIHVERVIGRIKDFKILQGPIPLTLADLIDPIFTVCGCIVNLLGILVPLSSKK